MDSQLKGQKELRMSMGVTLEVTMAPPAHRKPRAKHHRFYSVMQGGPVHCQTHSYWKQQLSSRDFKSPAETSHIERAAVICRNDPQGDYMYIYISKYMYT